MKNSKIFRNCIIIIILIIIILIITMFIIKGRQKDSEENIMVTNEINVSESDGNEMIENNVIKKDKNQTIETNETDVFDLQEGGSEYNSEHLNNYDFSIIDMDQDIKEKINNLDDFTFQMKEYIYLNGLVGGHTAKYINYTKNEKNVIKLEFILNDSEQTNIFAEVDLNNNTYKFSDNYLE